MGKAKGSTKVAPKKKSHSRKMRPPVKKKKGPDSEVKNVSKIGGDGSDLVEFDWTEIFILGEQIHTEAIDNIHQGPYPGVEWDFSHVQGVITSALQENPDCDIYLFGGSPSLVKLDFNNFKHVPVLNAIFVRNFHHPPELVAIKTSQQGTEEIVPFSSLKLKWQNVSGFPNGRVFSLQCMQRKTAMKNMKEEDLFKYEYSLLYTHRPSIDWTVDKYGKVDVQYANFTYHAQGLPEAIDEEFDKKEHRLKDFIPDFLYRFELDSSHYEGVEAAIRQGFSVTRDVKIQKMKLFESYDRDVLESMKVVKIYPKNDFVKDHHKNDHVNPYYGKATMVV